MPHRAPQQAAVLPRLDQDVCQGCSLPARAAHRLEALRTQDLLDRVRRPKTECRTTIQAEETAQTLLPDVEVSAEAAGCVDFTHEEPAAGEHAARRATQHVVLDLERVVVQDVEHQECSPWGIVHGA